MDDSASAINISQLIEEALAERIAQELLLVHKHAAFSNDAVVLDCPVLCKALDLAVPEHRDGELADAAERVRDRLRELIATLPEERDRDVLLAGLALSEPKLPKLFSRLRVIANGAKYGPVDVQTVRRWEGDAIVRLAQDIARPDPVGTGGRVFLLAAPISDDVFARMTIRDRKRFKLYRCHAARVSDVLTQATDLPGHNRYGRYHEYMMTKGSEYRMIRSMARLSRSQEELLHTIRPTDQVSPVHAFLPLYFEEARFICDLAADTGDNSRESADLMKDRLKLAELLEHDPWAMKLTDRIRSLMYACLCPPDRTPSGRKFHLPTCIWFDLVLELQEESQEVQRRSIELIESHGGEHRISDNFPVERARPAIELLRGTSEADRAFMSELLVAYRRDQYQPGEGGS